MAVDPTQNAGRVVLPPFPRSQNAEEPAVLMGAIVNASGDVTGYLPLKVEDNGDGTCTLIVKVAP